MSESDGVEEALGSALRVMLTAAARAGEEVARARQRERAAAADVSEARAAELAARLEAERAAARTSYTGLDDPDWWARADVDDVTSAYYTAAAWRDADPAAAAAADRIEVEVEERYGVRVRDLADELSSELGNDELHREAVNDAGRDTDRARDHAAAQAVEAGSLVAAADRADAQATAQVTSQVTTPATPATGPVWDSPQRRVATREALARVVDDPQAVQAKSLADLAQAHPVTAVTPLASKSVAAREDVAGTTIGQSRGSHLGNRRPTRAPDGPGR